MNQLLMPDCIIGVYSTSDVDFACMFSYIHHVLWDGTVPPSLLHNWKKMANMFL